MYCNCDVDHNISAVAYVKSGDALNDADNNVDFLNTKIEATHLTTALSFAGMFSLEGNPELFSFNF